MKPSVLGAIAGVAREPRPRTTWQIKVGTLCNLRCRYCYEWDRLGDLGRLSLGQWQRLFEVVRAHRIHRIHESGGHVDTMIVWHGGEPTLHPPEYVRAVIELQRDVLGEPTTGPGHLRNGVQTNLMAIGETLSLMVSAGFVVSVSVDFASGVRVNASGRGTDRRVRSNLERLLANGTSCGVALVLGRHNRERLAEAHDVLASLGAAWLNVTPMFRPPSAAPGRDLLLPPDEVVNILERLFIHWMEQGMRIPVYPLLRVLRMVLQCRSALPAEPDFARRHVRMIVQPDGTLQERVGATIPSVSLGNLFTHSFDDIVSGPAWQVARQRHDEGPCRMESVLCARLERWLDDAGVVALDQGVW